MAAERKRRSRTYSIENILEEVVAENYGIDLGLASYDSEGNFVEVAEEVEDILEEVREEADNVELEDDTDNEDFEETASVVSVPAKRPVMRSTLYSGGGKHLETKEKKPSETVEKAKKAGAGAIEKAKSFFKESVVPLFVEEQESEEDSFVEAPVASEEEDFEDAVPADTAEEDDISFKDMYASAKAGVSGFFKGAADLVNSKVINPIKEKMAEDEEEDYEEANVAESDERREALHVVNRRRRSVPVETEAEYSDEVDEEGEFYEDEDDEPGFWRKVWDRFVNPEDDYEDDMGDWEDEEEPSFFEAVKELLHKPGKADDDTVAEDVEYEEVVEEKPKGRLAAAIRRAFYEDDYDEEDYSEGAVVVDEFYPEDEDLQKMAIPDPDIYDAIVAENKQKKE